MWRNISAICRERVESACSNSAGMRRSKSSRRSRLGAWKVASINHFCRVSLIVDREESAIWPQGPRTVPSYVNDVRGGWVWMVREYVGDEYSFFLRVRLMLLFYRIHDLHR
jgi:hypothetical protein